MFDKKDIFEILEEFPQKQEVNPAVLDDAKKLANELYGKGKKTNKQRFPVYFRAIVSSLTVCLVFLAIFLPTYFHLNKTTEPVYYSADMVYSEDILDIDEFIKANNLSLKYFVGNMGGDRNKANYLVDSEKFVFIYQQVLFVGQNGFDKIDLGVVTTYDIFEKFGDFNLLDKNQKIESVSVNYRESTENGKIVIFSKFEYNDINYYLKIATTASGGKLDSYVKLLLA